jgi:chemotaxis protein methyltransferase CheR
MRLSCEVREHARSLIAARLGLHFPHERDDDLERRFLRAFQGSGAADPARYVSQLARLPADSGEWKRLVTQFTVGETYFFRDRGLFAALENDVLPPIIERRRGDGSLRLRIWSAGCSSGEEPYSLAMLLDRLLRDRSRWSITILATDINTRTLSAAARGVYRAWSFRDAPDGIRDRYFTARSGGTFELDPEIRRMVTFTPLNLVDGAYPSPATNTSAMDVILCRNVIMYFTRDAQRETVSRLQQALLEGGWLGVSAAEASADLLRPLEPVAFRDGVLFRKTAAQAVTVPKRPEAPPPSPRRPPRPVPAQRPRPREEPRLPADLLARARVEADRGNLDHARDLCRDAVERDRLDPEAHLLLAEIEQERGDFRAALAAVRSAVYLAPDSPVAHFVLGSLRLRSGDRANARESMRTVVSLLQSVPADQVVDGTDGLPAGRLLETAAGHLEER